jgi:RNase P/RNase MRP subunit POP5
MNTIIALGILIVVLYVAARNGMLRAKREEQIRSVVKAGRMKNMAPERIAANILRTSGVVK